MMTWLMLAAAAVLLIAVGRWNHLRGRTHRWVCQVCHFQAASDHMLEQHLAEHDELP